MSLQSKGVKASYLSNHYTDKEHDAIVGSKYSHLFTSPEAVLQASKWRKMILPTEILIAIAIDEAHCIIKW